MKKKEVFAWGMYDLANTAFSALFVTFFFPLYIRYFLGGNEFQIGLTFGLSMLLVGILVPVIGAWSDRIGKRMPFIIFFTILCCLATVLVSNAGLLVALILGFVANFAYHAALTTYNALLPLLGKPREYGKISGIGVAMGYVGTLLSIGMAAVILSRLGWESLIGIKAMFPATAIFFFVFSIFLFFGVKEVGRRVSVTWGRTVSLSFSSVWKTVKTLAKHKGMISYLLMLFMYVNAVTAVIIFLYLYGRSVIGLSIQWFMVVYALFSLSAVIGSYAFGRIVDRIGPKKSLSIAGILWLAVIVVLLFVQNLPMFIFAGLLGGVALGTVWTASRPLLIKLSPKKEIGKFFGFSELANKFSGVLGPIVFGALVRFYSYPVALIALGIFFLAGLLILQKVPA